MLKGYFKPKEWFFQYTIQCILPRFARVFLGIWLNFIGYPQKIVMKYLRNVHCTPMSCKSACASITIYRVSSVLGPRPLISTKFGPDEKKVAMHGLEAHWLRNMGGYASLFSFPH